MPWRWCRGSGNKNTVSKDLKSDQKFFVLKIIGDSFSRTIYFQGLVSDCWNISYRSTHIKLPITTNETIKSPPPLSLCASSYGVMLSLRNWVSVDLTQNHPWVCLIGNLFFRMKTCCFSGSKMCDFLEKPLFARFCVSSHLTWWILLCQQTQYTHIYSIYNSTYKY